MISSVDHDWVGYTGDGKMRRNEERREGQEILVSFFYTHRKLQTGYTHLLHAGVHPHGACGL